MRLVGVITEAMGVTADTAIRAVITVGTTTATVDMAATAVTAKVDMVVTEDMGTAVTVVTDMAAMGKVGTVVTDMAAMGKVGTETVAITTTQAFPFAGS